MYKLVIADDEGSKSTVPVIRDEITIGRKEGNTIRLTERNVSRQHAKVVRDNGRIYIEEIAARYGIKKNGVKIDQRAEFAPGDVVSIGDYKLTLKTKKPDKAPEPPARPERKTQPLKKDKRDEGTQVLPAMPAKLVVISSNFAGQEFPLNRKEMIIGRAEDCDIIIDHRAVSQKHAKVIREAGNEYQIVDLNSRNGVTIGGEKYRAVHIKRGDVIELGHVKFRFVEPGENYVFTPQPELDDVEISSGNSNNVMMIGAVVVVALLAAAGIFVVMSGDGTDTNDGEQTQAEASQPPDDEATGGAVAGEGAPDDQPDHSRVSEAIDEARDNVSAGELDKAIGALESASKYLDPTPEQNDTIAELMGSAKTEKPFKRDYESAKDDIERGDFKDALERLSEIPKHSVFYGIYQEEGLRDEAIDGLVVRAEDALAKDDGDEARELAEDALGYDSQHDGANSLLERLEDDDVKMAMKADEKRSGSSGSSGSSHGSSTGSGSSGSSKPQKPAKPSLSREEAKALYASAQKKIFGNDPSGAIADCKKALTAGQSACYRILAIAYKQTGKTDQACANFKRYLGTGPSNVAAVEREMEKLGCD
ncbi:MAG: FHA domain-containing protein [Persicimonas sp.]